jgi:hypothetical protein
LHKNLAQQRARPLHVSFALPDHCRLPASASGSLRSRHSTRRLSSNRLARLHGCVFGRGFARGPIGSGWNGPSRSSR